MKPLNRIIVYGPKDIKNISPNELVINTTSHSNDWSREFSPFYLGPVKTYNNITAYRFENYWQYLKCYKCHVDGDGNPTEEYFQWAKDGWENPIPVRYPMGKGAKPEYLYFNGEKLNYIEGRLLVYFPMYRNLVRKTKSFNKLKDLYLNGNKDLYLFDFDGYQYENLKMKLTDVLLNKSRPMGHAFVLECMLKHGENVDPYELIDKNLQDEFE